MSYTITNPQPAARAEGAADIAPGLYPGELALTLDTTDAVAVQVTPERMGNGQGVIFDAACRAITTDGTTRLCASGVPIITTYRQLCVSAQIDRFGVDALAKEHVLGVLGEPPTLVDLLDSSGGGVFEADGVTPVQVPMLGTLDALVAAQISVRRALVVCGALEVSSPLAILL